MKQLMTADEIRKEPDSWHVRRREGITASEIGLILGLAPASHGNPYTLYVEKQGGDAGESEDRNDEMTRGLALEPYVSERAAQLLPELAILPGGLYASSAKPWMMATFDRLGVDLTVSGYQLHEIERMIDTRHGIAGWPHLRKAIIPVELKTSQGKQADPLPDYWWGEPGTDQVPVHIKAQALWQMAVAEADTVLIPVQFMVPWQTCVYVIRRTEDAEEDIQFMEEEAAAFLDRLVNSDPPEIDWTPETARALRTIHPLRPETVWTCPKGLATRWQRAYRAKQRAEERLGLVQNTILDRSAGAQRVEIPDPDNPKKTLLVLSRSEYDMHPLDSDGIRQEAPELARKHTKTVHVSKVNPGRKWAAWTPKQES